jgi:autotransporter-associated beta strand protein
MLFPNTTFQFDAAFDLNLNRKISTLISGGPAIDTNGFNVTIASAITGSFTKAGQGTLTLTGTNSGGVTVAAGALRANDGAGLPVRNLVLNGGVLEGLGATTFTRGLATSGNGTMQWTGSGGFSASGGKMTVAIGGAASLTALVWGSGHFVPSGAALLFGSTTADGETEFQNAIDLAAGTRTVTVTDNPAASGDFATISGTITNGVFVKDGPGALRLLAANAYAGGTTVKAGMLIAAASGALGSGPVQLGDVSGAASPALLFENASTVASTITVQDDGSPTSLRTLGGTNTSGRASFAGGVTLLKDLTLTAALGGEVELAGTLDDSAGRTITKIGDGLIILDGTHTYGTGAVLSVLGGKVELDTDAGSASVATLVVNVTGAELDFGSDQHLDTLDIGPGGIVRFTGARTVVLNHLVMEGIDYGAATITPEPATLALLASGGLLALARRREDGKTRSNRDSSS